MIRLLSLFSGIGAFETALKRLNIPFETVAYCEIDKYASKAYSMLHGISEDFNLHDVRTADVSNLHDIDLVTYGFPCQDISLSGRQKGFYDNEGNKTRSGLFFDALRIIETVKPKYAIAENVKSLTSRKFAEEFSSVLGGLSDAGYNNYYSVLNAKDFGIPQNRERVFIVSIRKDIDTGDFRFPNGKTLLLRLKDMLEENVPERFFLDEKRGGVKKLFDSLEQEDTQFILEPVIAASRGRNKDNPGDRTAGIPTEQRLEINSDGLCNTLTTVQKDNYVLEPVIKQIGNVTISERNNPNAGRVYDPNGISPTLNTSQGGNLQPCIIVKGELTGPDSKKRVLDPAGISYTMCATDYKDPVKVLTGDMKIRKLTPREYWRLMGFTDNEFNRVKGISNTQLYKMAGNSIVVNVLEALFRQLFKR
jgi:DNA (cytosine-5)-methyltransferase 1